MPSVIGLKPPPESLRLMVLCDCQDFIPRGWDDRDLGDRLRGKKVQRVLYGRSSKALYCVPQAEKAEPAALEVLPLEEDRQANWFQYRVFGGTDPHLVTLNIGASDGYDFWPCKHVLAALAYRIKSTMNKQIVRFLAHQPEGVVDVDFVQFHEKLCGCFGSHETVLVGGGESMMKDERDRETVL